MEDVHRLVVFEIGPERLADLRTGHYRAVEGKEEQQARQMSFPRVDRFAIQIDIAGAKRVHPKLHLAAALAHVVEIAGHKLLVPQDDRFLLGDQRNPGQARERAAVDHKAAVRRNMQNDLLDEPLNIVGPVRAIIFIQDQGEWLAG